MRTNQLAGILLLLVLLAGCEAGPTELVGTLECYRIDLTNEASEPIIERAVREGDQVATGQLLIRLDGRRMQAQVDQAEATLARAQARLDELIRGPRREIILETQAQVEEARIQLRNAREELDRIATLVQRQLASQSQLDQMRTQRDAAQARLEATNARLSAQLEGTTLEELNQARAAVQEARAGLDQARIKRERMDILAPVDGRVEALPFQLGEQPPAGSTLVVLLADSPAFARVYLPADMRAQLQSGDRAQVSIADIGQVLEGQIRFLSARAGFTPFFALTEHDRGRLSYLTEIEILGDLSRVPTGVAVTVTFPSLNIRP